MHMSPSCISTGGLQKTWQGRYVKTSSSNSSVNPNTSTLLVHESNNSSISSLFVTGICSQPYLGECQFNFSPFHRAFFLERGVHFFLSFYRSKKNINDSSLIKYCPIQQISRLRETGTQVSTLWNTWVKRSNIILAEPPTLFAIIMCLNEIQTRRYRLTKPKKADHNNM